MSLRLTSTRDFQTVYTCEVWGQWLSFIFHCLKQYHALNTVVRLFHSYAEISNVLRKINYDGQIFKTLRKSSLMVKVCKYSIKSEAAIHGCTIKKLFWRVLKTSQENTFAWASSNKIAGLQPENFFEKDACTRAFL